MKTEDFPSVAPLSERARDEAQEKGIVYINENFTSKLMEETLHRLEKIAENKNIEGIEIRINSNGGDVYALFTLVDWIDRCEKPVTTRVLGKAFSAGALLLLSGHKGKRIAGKSSFILLHEVASDLYYNKKTHHSDSVDRLKQINDKLKSLITSRTKMSDEEVDKYMESGRDIFITSQQAKRYGIIDKIV